jgi:hypothetical protein
LTSLAFGFTLSDIDASNAAGDFHGLDLGLAGKWKQVPWSLEWRGKVALGANFNSAAIGGMTTTNFGGVPTTSPGGSLPATTCCTEPTYSAPAA